MEIFKTMCVVTRAGRSTGPFKADTILMDGIPYVVFDWKEDGEPGWLVALDSRYWKKVVGQADATHMYEFPIRDPRPLS